MRTNGQESDDSRLVDLPQTKVVANSRNLFDYANRVLKYFEDFKQTITDKGLVSYPPKHYEVFLLTSSTQVELNFMSSLRLLAEGHVIEAFILLRTSYELLIFISYMLKDPTGRGRDWEDYNVVYRIKSLQRATKVGDVEQSLYQDELNRLLNQNKSEIDKFTRPKHLDNPKLLERKYYANWTRRASIRDIAVCADQKDLYDQEYEYFTLYVHPTSEIWNRYFVFSDEGKFIGLGPVLDATKKEVLHTIQAGSYSLLLLVEFLCKHFQLKLEEEHSNLCVELKQITEQLMEAE